MRLLNATEYAAWLTSERAAKKAVQGGPWLSALQSGPSLSTWGTDYQSRAAQYLSLYRVGWFYKAGSRVARDVSALDVTLSYEDSAGDNAEEIACPPANTPFASLTPGEQLLRLMERPNPYQTGHVLRHKTQVRLDFAGRAFWWLEGGEGGALPTAIYGVSPARMWPSRNARGELIGWVMDRNAPSGGTPFSADEIIPFSYPTAEDDLDLDGGQSVVEPVYAQRPISDLLARHEADVLSTGGRLAGMAWPKNRTLDEDEFLDAQRAWRNVTSDPNAARRLLIFPEPMEYAAGAATPEQIGIPELATLSRDEICSAWPISPSMLGIPQAGGLNSGETRRWERKEYWEGTIHPRAEVLEDSLQQWLVPRYEEAVGRPLDLDLEEPSLDDAAALIEKAAALKALTEQGFDTAESIAAVGLDHIKWVEPAPVPMPQPMIDQQGSPPQGAESAAVSERGSGQTVTVAVPVVKSAPTRDERIGEVLPGMHAAVQAFLDAQRDRIAAALEEELAPISKAQRIKAVPTGWWDQKREDRLLAEAMHSLYIRLSRSALQAVSDLTDRLIPGKAAERIALRMVEQAAERIRGINETTRDAVTRALELALPRGYSVAQIVGGVPAEGYAGIAGLPQFDPARAELVARTETMLGYNASNLMGYGEMGVSMVEPIDGDGDQECIDRVARGAVSIEEALADEDHPNGTLDWIPLTDKAWHREDALLAAVKALAERPAPVFNAYITPQPVTVDAPVTVNVPEQQAPSVTVLPAEAAVVNVAAPVVNVESPAVTVLPAEVTVNLPEQPAAVVTVHPAEAPVVNITLPEQRSVTKTVARGADGSYTVTEVPDGE